MPRMYKDRCAKCRAEIICWAFEAEEAPKPGDPQCDGIMCDAHRRSCFDHFCGKECYDAHWCPGKPEEDSDESV